MREIDAQGSAMCWQHFDVDRHQTVGGRDTLHREQREIGKVLVIDRVELVLGDQPLEMRDFDRDNALRAEEEGHAGDEVVELRHLRQNVVGGNQVCVAVLGDDLSCGFSIEERREAWESPGREPFPPRSRRVRYQAPADRARENVAGGSRRCYRARRRSSRSQD